MPIEHGITSAYAEKSSRTAIANLERGNYLRIRGEELLQVTGSIERLELPPHTRRRGQDWWGCTASVGITSAYAEKSTASKLMRMIFRNYLRIRGEEA